LAANDLVHNIPSDRAISVTCLRPALFDDLVRCPLFPKFYLKTSLAICRKWSLSAISVDQGAERVRPLHSGFLPNRSSALFSRRNNPPYQLVSRFCVAARARLQNNARRLVRRQHNPSYAWRTYCSTKRALTASGSSGSRFNPRDMSPSVSSNGNKSGSGNNGNHARLALDRIVTRFAFDVIKRAALS